MSKKLYVGNLPFTTTSETLKEAFQKAGEVEEAVVMTDKMTGRPRGFGFVTMVADETAQSAIDMYNDQEFEGRRLVVNEARPKEERTDRPHRPFNRDRQY